jgi:hypothetical protein
MIASQAYEAIAAIPLEWSALVDDFRTFRPSSDQKAMVMHFLSGSGVKWMRTSMKTTKTNKFNYSHLQTLSTFLLAQYAKRVALAKPRAK